METTNIIIHKGEETREIHPIDLQAWLNDGWSVNPPAIAPVKEYSSNEPAIPRVPDIDTQELPGDTPIGTATALQMNAEEAQLTADPSAEPPSSDKINLNSDSLEKIASLPGVTTAKAKKVRDARPIADADALSKAEPSVEWNAIADQWTL